MIHKLCCENIKLSTTSDAFTRRQTFTLRHRRIRCLRQKIPRFRLFAESNDDKWKLLDLDSKSVHESFNSWISKTQRILTDVASPLVKSKWSRKSNIQNSVEVPTLQEVFIGEQTVDGRTRYGNLSMAAIVSIEQFSRLNGLTGYKMQKIFNSLFPDHGDSYGQNLVEYCCFRFLSKDSSSLHPSLREPAFQQLIFITMLAWDTPYSVEHDSGYNDFQGKLVHEEAFIRIAPAIPGVADHPTAYNLFKSLCGFESGVSLDSWLTYVSELLKVHESRKTLDIRPHPLLSEETILCIGSSRKQPVLKWEDNMAWPGKVVLTEKALYFEAVGLGQKKDVIRFDLSKVGLQLSKTKVGPLGSALFDSALSISYGPRTEKWVLEFVNLGGESRRDVWHAFISEVVSLHKFIREYGPANSDQYISQVFGAHKGDERAKISALNSIARLQVLQFVHKVFDDPIRIVQFSFLYNAPFGELVLQTLALKFWGGPVVKKVLVPEDLPTDRGVEHRSHLSDIDGSVYLRDWMRSPSWSTNASVNFWKSCSVKQGVILSKNLVVGERTPVEKAAATCMNKSKVVDKTQATIDAAMLKGIPSNIDLLKELLLPLSLAARNFETLRRWEKPQLTVTFLVVSYSIILRNLLPCVFPAMLILLAAVILMLKGLRRQGRLSRLFGAVTIHDQPSSNTIQKIIALKDAMRDLESYLQNLNIALLKIRAIFLGGHHEIATEVAVVFLTCGLVLLIIPLKYVLSFVLFDLFTRELEFRKELVKKFVLFLKDRWNQIPAAPVVVLPFRSDESSLVNQNEDRNF